MGTWRYFARNYIISTLYASCLQLEFSKRICGDAEEESDVYVNEMVYCKRSSSDLHDWKVWSRGAVESVSQFEIFLQFLNDCAGILIKKIQIFM